MTCEYPETRLQAFRALARRSSRPTELSISKEVPPRGAERGRFLPSQPRRGHRAVAGERKIPSLYCTRRRPGSAVDEIKIVSAIDSAPTGLNVEASGQRSDHTNLVWLQDLLFRASPRGRPPFRLGRRGLRAAVGRRKKRNLLSWDSDSLGPSKGTKGIWARSVPA